MSFETISVIGLGYIGLPTAAMFASRKKQVIGVDVNPVAVDTINNGKIHIIEPDLDMVVSAAVSQGYLRATLSPEPADAFLVAVPTPFKPVAEGAIPQPDLAYIMSAAGAIGPVLKRGDLVILESTSPVGTTEQLAQRLAEERPDLSFPQTHGADADVNIAHCPERVLPGRVMQELVQNDRVIGGMTSRCSQRASELYSVFVQGECVVTTARTAEMAKLTENSFRDVNIAFANELSIICDKLDINVWELIALANRHPRVNILQPGPGVGGHCIAVDPWFIVARNMEESPLIHTARKVNDRKKDWVVGKVEKAIVDFLQVNPDKTVKDVVVACYGLAFKPDIDDLRESPALAIVSEVASAHPGQIKIYEPNVGELPLLLSTLENVDLLSLNSIVGDISVLLVKHSEFYELEYKNSVVIDCVGLLDE